jgi:hypothetical protein
MLIDSFQSQASHYRCRRHYFSSNLHIHFYFIFTKFYIHFSFRSGKQQWDNIDFDCCRFPSARPLPTHGKVGFQGHILYTFFPLLLFFSHSDLPLLLLLRRPSILCCVSFFLSYLAASSLLHRSWFSYIYIFFESDSYTRNSIASY